MSFKELDKLKIEYNELFILNLSNIMILDLLNYNLKTLVEHKKNNKN